MKNLKIFSLFALVALFAFTSCKNDKATASTDEASASVVSSDAAKPATPAVNATPEPTGPTTSMEFGETTYDFGEVMEGEKVVHVYKFKNTGSEPLVISNAKGSCGCTVPEWPKEPIPVGASGEIKVQFDSKGKGKDGGQLQSKRVTITANTDPVNTYLTIKGKVNKDPNAPVTTTQPTITTQPKITTSTK